MLFKLDRILTRSEIERIFGIPQAEMPDVMAGVPVGFQDKGIDHSAGSTVDRAVDAHTASATGRQHQTCQPAPKGKPGRRNTTADIALVANDLKGQGKTWKEIHAACESRFPGRVRNLEQVRTIWRRRFGGKN
jgi:hypothetical protein